MAADPVNWIVNVNDGGNFSIKHRKGLFEDNQAIIKELIRDILGKYLSPSEDANIYFMAAKNCPLDPMIELLIILKSDLAMNYLSIFFDRTIGNYSFKDVKLTLLSLNYISSCSLTMCRAICAGDLTKGQLRILTLSPTLIAANARTIPNQEGSFLVDFLLGPMTKNKIGPFPGAELLILFDISSSESTKIYIKNIDETNSQEYLAAVAPKLNSNFNFGYYLKTFNRSSAGKFYKFAWRKEGIINPVVVTGPVGPVAGLESQHEIEFKLTSGGVSVSKPMSKILFSGGASDTVLVTVSDDSLVSGATTFDIIVPPSSEVGASSNYDITGKLAEGDTLYLKTVVIEDNGEWIQVQYKIDNQTEDASKEYWYLIYFPETGLRRVISKINEAFEYTKSCVNGLDYDDVLKYINQKKKEINDASSYLEQEIKKLVDDATGNLDYWLGIVSYDYKPDNGTCGSIGEHGSKAPCPEKVLIFCESVETMDTYITYMNNIISELKSILATGQKIKFDMTKSHLKLKYNSGEIYSAGSIVIINPDGTIEKL